MKRIVLAAIISIALATTAVAGVSPNSRLLLAPEFDGAVVADYWLRGAAAYISFDGGDAFGLVPTFAMPLLDNHLELGARWALVHVSPDRGDNETGMGNLNLWGKYLVLDDPLLLSVGSVITLPVGSDKVVVDVFQIAGFGALRYYVEDDLALIGRMSLRYTDDWKGLDGQIQFGLGAGAIYQVIPELNLSLEFNLETEQFKNMDNYIALTGGAEYLISEDISLQGGLTVGLDDAAPDFEAIGAVNFKF